MYMIAIVLEVAAHQYIVLTASVQTSHYTFLYPAQLIMNICLLSIISIHLYNTM